MKNSCIVFGQGRRLKGKVVIFGQKWLYFVKAGWVCVKWLCFEPNGNYMKKWSSLDKCGTLYLRKRFVVLGLMTFSFSSNSLALTVRHSCKAKDS